jgi:hypothetical protein
MASLLKMPSAALCYLFWKRLEAQVSAQNSPCYSQSGLVSCRHLKNSLEADVDIILPDGLSVRSYFLQLIEREGGHFHFPISPH